MADRPFPLAKVYVVANHCLVWSIDLHKDQQVCTQIIKLWNLVPRADVEGLLKRMDYIFSMYTDAYMERCKTISLDEYVPIPKLSKFAYFLLKFSFNYSVFVLYMQFLCVDHFSI